MGRWQNSLLDPHQMMKIVHGGVDGKMTKWQARRTALDEEDLSAAQLVERMVQKQEKEKVEWEKKRIQLEEMQQLNWLRGCCDRPTRVQQSPGALYFQINELGVREASALVRH